MSTASPSVRRMISVLNFFLEHPQQSFTIAQVVKSLKLNRATCHAIINGLADARYLFRNSDKTYVLGPAIFAIARRSELALSALDIAKYEMRDLADKLDVIVSAQFLENGQVASRARAASSSNLNLNYPAGVRYSLHPWGVVFLAPLTPSQLEHEFKTADPPLTTDEIETERKLVDYVRSHGYAYAVQDQSVLGGSMRMGGAPGRLMTEINDDEVYALQFVSAPVIDEGGLVAFELVLSAFKGEYTGKQIAEIGREVVASCDRISSFITGN